MAKYRKFGRKLIMTTGGNIKGVNYLTFIVLVEHY